MDRFERIYQLHHILSGRRTPIANKELQERLECSEVTVKRLITVMRGLFGDHIVQLQKRVEKLLALDQSSAGRKLESVKTLTMAARPKGINPMFNKIASALFERQQLHLTYQARSHGETSARTVSPQTLPYYRDNWYLDAWCHSKNALRTFAVENIKAACRLNQPAKVFEREQLEDYYASVYGIFSGKAQHLAKLKFTPEFSNRNF